MADKDDDLDEDLDEDLPEDPEDGAESDEMDPDADGETVADDEDFPDPDDLDFGEDFDDDDEDGEPDPEKAAKRKKLVLIAGGSVLALVLLGGIGLVLFAGGGDEMASAEDDPTRVIRDLPPPGAVKRREAAKSLVRPPARRSLADRAAASQPSQSAAGSRQQQSAQQATAPSGGGGGAGSGGGSLRGLVIPSVTAASFTGIPEVPRGEPLRKAPIQSMAEPGPNGVLPVLSPSGTPSWRAYGRPFEGDASKPRLSVVVTGLGLSRASTLAAIEQLPPDVTLSFDPYARNLRDWLSLARGAGHEVLIGLPLETENLNLVDPGPYALLTDVDEGENITKLNTVMSLAPGYVGLLVQTGSLFATSEQALSPVLSVLQQRGLIVMESGQSSQSLLLPVAEKLRLPHAVADFELDTVPSRTAIPAVLTELEAKARQDGQAIAVAQPLPISIRLITEWSLNLPQRNLQLVPLTANLRRVAPAPDQQAQ